MLMCMCNTSANMHICADADSLNCNVYMCVYVLHVCVLYDVPV